MNYIRISVYFLINYSPYRPSYYNFLTHRFLHSNYCLDFSPHPIIYPWICQFTKLVYYLTCQISPLVNLTGLYEYLFYFMEKQLLSVHRVQGHFSVVCYLFPLPSLPFSILKLFSPFTHKRQVVGVDFIKYNACFTGPLGEVNKTIARGLVAQCMTSSIYFYFSVLSGILVWQA